MPDWKALVRRRVSALGLSPTRETEVIDELAQHLDDRYRELVAGGTRDAEAFAITLGGLDRDDRFARRMSILKQAGHRPRDLPFAAAFSPTAMLVDLRHSARGLRKSRGFAFVAILTLAVGIGANAAVFSAVRTILFQPLPFQDSSRLVNVWLSRSGRPNWHFHVPAADFAVLRAGNQMFDAMAMYDSESRVLTGAGGPDEVTTGLVSVDLFPMLGVQPSLGSTFSTLDRASDDAVVVLSNALWRRRFSADPSAIGKSISLDRQPYRVIGVMAPGFVFPNQADLWVPRDRSDQSSAYVLAKLRPDVTLAQGQASMAAVVAAITGGRPTPGMAFTLETLQTTTTKNASASWLILLGAVGCVFAIGCVNILNLMLARGLQRRREIDLRLALGATRGQIIRLFAAECLLLAGAGGALAVGVAFWILEALRAWAPGDTPRLTDLHADPALLWSTLALSVLTAAALGVLPALQFSRVRVSRALTAHGRSVSTNRAQARARDALVVVEIALALVLLVGAALLVRSLWRLSQVDPGFRTDHLLTATLHVPSSRYGDPLQRLNFLERLHASIAGLQTVSTAALSSGSMMTGLGLPGAQRTLAQRISREGGPVATGPEEANLRQVDVGFFHTLGIPILEGRSFSDRDRTDAPPVAIVNRTMARTYWGTASVIGRRVSFERAGGAPVWLEIVGVSGDTRDIALTAIPQPAFFVPLRQNSSGLDADAATLYVRTPADPAALANAIRQAIWSVDASQPIAEISTMEMAIDRFIEAPRFRTGLLAGLAAVGLVLSVIGIYGVVSYGVTERVPELAVRLALGAERRHIIALVLRRGVALTVAGLGVGLLAFLACVQLLRTVLFDIAPLDPVTLTTAPLLILGVAAVACYLPARRAAATDAVRAMRGDTG